MKTLDRLIYDPERLACTNEEKEACLETVRKLARLAGQFRRNSILYADVLAEEESDPFLRACLLEFDDATAYEDMAERFGRIARDYLAAGNYHGGAFLNAVLVVKGLLLMLQVVNEQPTPAAWGNLLSFEVRGFFGPEYRERVMDAIKQETRLPKKKRQASFILEFDRFAELDLSQRQALLRESDLRYVTLAFKGAGEKTENAILEALTEDARAALKDNLKFLDNLRLIDITQPQEVLLKQWNLVEPGEALTQCVPEDELLDVDKKV